MFLQCKSKVNKKKKTSKTSTAGGGEKTMHTTPGKQKHLTFSCVKQKREDVKAGWRMARTLDQGC